ncbi:hypothetical protein, partial [Acetobacterium tundrae]|uniref:hypothetical protein n=1 Tax=Acetobacterium tundrae TaxID=132932 RepID=UPI001A9A7E01
SSLRISSTMAAFSSGDHVRRFLFMCIVYLIFWNLCPTICEHYLFAPYSIDNFETLSNKSLFIGNLGYNYNK